MEFHSFFDLPHSSSSTTDVLGSMHLKALMETYYDLGPGASSAKYKDVRELISSFGKGDKDRFFDIRKFSNDLQQARGAYEVVFNLTSGVREVLKPVEETATELLQQ
jgi:hypothetical protein